MRHCRMDLACAVLGSSARRSRRRRRRPASRLRSRPQTYRIAGKTGAALLEAMDRSGPKHGFLTRAIAQTQLFGRLDHRMGRDRQGLPRRARRRRRLSITYTFPRAAGDAVARPEAALADVSWPACASTRRCMARIARQMASAAEKAIARPADRQRSRLPQDAHARRSAGSAAIYAEYEARQIALRRDGAPRRRPRRAADRQR